MQIANCINIISRVLLITTSCFLFIGLEKAKSQKMEIGLGINTLMYQGDLSSDFPIAQIGDYNLGGTVFFRHNVSKSSTFRYSFMYGQLSANGSNSPNIYINELMPQSFQTPIYELSGVYEYNFFNYRHERYRRMSPYAFAGLGVFNFNPQTTEPGANPLAYQIFLPVGFGFKYIIMRKWNLGFEFAGRKLFTDYLDGVSDQSVGGMQTGDPFNNDWYMHFMLSISYTIYTVPCPFNFY